MNESEIRIYSRNSDFQYLETLRRNRKKRSQSGEFFIEGVRAISLALRHHWKFNGLVYSRESRLSNWATEIIETAKASRHYILSSQLLSELSQKEEPSELIALLAIPQTDLDRIFGKSNNQIVVLDRPALPGNIGTVIRSCDAFQADGVIITGHSADLFDPETIRASTGSFFSVPAARISSHESLIPWIEHLKNREQGLQVVGTSEKGEMLLHEFDFTQPSMLLFGNESHGLSESYRTLCDVTVKIPIGGSASSLNLANAVSIFLYEITRQRYLDSQST